MHLAPTEFRHKLQAEGIAECFVTCACEVSRRLTATHSVEHNDGARFMAKHEAQVNAALSEDLGRQARTWLARKDLPEFSTPRMTGAHISSCEVALAWQAALAAWSCTSFSCRGCRSFTFFQVSSSSLLCNTWFRRPVGSRISATVSASFCCHCWPGRSRTCCQAASLGAAERVGTAALPLELGPAGLG